MKSVHGAFRGSPSWSCFLGFLTAIAALPFAAIHAVAQEKSPAGSPQEAGEHHAAPAVSLAAPAAVTGTANREKSAATVVVYPVDEVLAKIREDGLDETAARGLLEMWVKGAMSTASSLVPPPAATQNVDPQRILWLKGRMVVQTIEAGHRQIRDTLEVIRKFGAAEVALEVRFVCLDEKEVKEILPSGTTSAVEAPAERSGRRCLCSAGGIRPSVGELRRNAGHPGSIRCGAGPAATLPCHGQSGGPEVARALPGRRSEQRASGSSHRRLQWANGQVDGHIADAVGRRSERGRADAAAADSSRFRGNGAATAAGCRPVWLHPPRLRRYVLEP